MKSNKLFPQIRYWAFLNLGILLMACGVSFFKTPNNFATGGVSGISLLLYRLFPVFAASDYMLVINVLLLIIGILVLGKNCGMKTIFCSMLFSVETWLIERFFPLSSPLTDQPLMELVYAILLTGIGSAILFFCGASSGGTDIVALILKKHSSLDVGKALLLTDFLIAGSNFFISGVQPGLFSLLGLFAKAFLVDNIIESFRLCKAFTIITNHPEEISEYIIKTLHHGVTSYQAVGEYTGQPRAVLMTVCRRADAYKLKVRVKEADPNAFIIVTNSSEIIGRGFRSE